MGICNSHDEDDHNDDEGEDDEKFCSLPLAFGFCWRASAHGNKQRTTGEWKERKKLYFSSGNKLRDTVMTMAAPAITNDWARAKRLSVRFESALCLLLDIYSSIRLYYLNKCYCSVCLCMSMILSVYFMPLCGMVVLFSAPLVTA